MAKYQLWIMVSGTSPQSSAMELKGETENPKLMANVYANIASKSPDMRVRSYGVARNGKVISESELFKDAELIEA